MSFLDDFDKRAARKPGDPAPDGETPEDRELLDFADLIRSRRALPEDGERQRVLERVKAKQSGLKSEPIPGGPEFRRSWPNLRLTWPALMVAALVCLVIGLSAIRPNQAPSKPIATISTKDRMPAMSPTEVKKSAAALVSVSKPIFGSNRAPNEEFANLEFPKPQLKEGDGKTVESNLGTDAARLVRVQGLAMFQKKGETRWRVANRGQVFNPGDVIRASKRLESCVRILGPDGSAVSLATNGVLKYAGPRNWSLHEGSAYFEVASRKDLPEFTVTTPHGKAIAKGTVFTLDAGKGEADESSATLCWVDDGEVAVIAPETKAINIKAGTSALFRKGQVKRNAPQYAKEWLATLQRAAENDHGIGQLVAKSEKANEHLPLEVKSHSVSVTVVDQVARTFVDEVFINNTDNRLEGTFYYPLPADASISEFAMYVGDQRIVGEVLEQQRARQIFEYIVRQQRDPALLEYAGGNLFKMRVFPIEPHSEKRIQLGYTQILPRSNGKVTYTYPLYSEMLLKNPLLDLKIEFRAISTPGLSDLTSPTHSAPSALSNDGKRGALAFRAKNYSPTRDFSVSYSVPDGAECVAFANLRPDDPLGYFMVQLCPKAPLPQRDPPQRMLVVVDGSASAGAKDYAVATEFAASAADVSGNWQYGIVRGGQKPQSFGEMAFANPDTSTKVRDFLQKSPPLGATDLLETFRQTAALVKANEGLQLVYVGDGIDTVSELSGPALVNEIAALFKGKGVKVSTVAVGSSYDGPVLKGIAAKLGGTFTRVEGASDVHAAVGQVFDSFYCPMLWDMMVNFEEVDVSGIYPEFVGTLAAGDTAVVLGRFNREKAVRGKVSLLADVGGTMAERKYDIDFSADETNNRFLPRLWAKAHIDALLGTMGLGSANDDARTKLNVIETSINFQIMSPFTAFLVLESEEDYKRFGIKRTMKKWDWTGDANALRGSQRQDAAKMPMSAPGASAAPSTFWADTFSTEFIPADGTLGGELGVDEVEELGVEFEHRGKKESLSKAQREEDSDVLTRLGAEKDAAFDYESPESLEQAQEGLAEDESLGRVLERAKRDDLSEDLYFREADKKANTSFRRRAYGGRRAGYNYPQYNSLIFHGGTVVEIEIDQPLRPVAHYQRLAASGKGTLSTQLNLCLALEQLGRFDDALKALAVVIEKAPMNVDLRLQEGSLRYRSQDIAGGKAAFAKALELAAEKDRAAVKERIAGLLASLGQYADAADEFAALARSAEKAEQATQRAQMAANYYTTTAAKVQKAWPLWEEVLKRWPDDAKMLAAAGIYAANNGQLERGVELVRAARKRDPRIAADLIHVYAQRGMRDEALSEYREILGGGDSNRVYSALSGLYSLGQALASDEALKLLGEKHSVAEIIGGLQYLQSYSAVRNRAGFDAVHAMLQRADVPPQARISAFYVLNGARNNGVALKFDATAILGGLLENPRTPEQWGFAQQALSALSSYGFQKEALDAVQKLSQRKDLPEHMPAYMAQMEFNALNALGRNKDADEKALKALDLAKDAHSAYSPAWQAFWSRLNRKELEGAAQIAESYARRFPDSQYLPQFYSHLLQHLRQSEKKDDALALVEKLAKANPENAFYFDLRARMLASQGKFRDAAASVREGIKILSKPLPDILVPDILRPGGEKIKVDPVPAELPKEDPEKKHEFYKKEMQKRTQLIEWRKSQRSSLIALLSQLSAQDAELRTAFLKECDENAKSEDPAQREWTEAALTALSAAGDVESYLKRLQALALAEPNDPLWARRLGNALASNKKWAEARSVLAKISDAQREDVELALRLVELSTRLKDAPAAENYFARAFEVLSKQPNLMQQYASQWQQSKPEWALKAWKHLLEKEPAQGSYAAYAAAGISQQIGKEKEAAELYFRCLAAPDTGYAQSALNSLVSLCQKEEHLRALLPQAYKALETPEGKKSVYLNLLAYHLEKIRATGQPAEGKDAVLALARKALDAAAAIELPADGYSAGSYVASVLAQDGQFERAEKYALEGGGKLSADARRNLIRQSANSFNNGKELKRGINLYKMLLATPDQNSENDYSQLVNLLIQDGQLAAAEDMARKVPATRNSWVAYNVWSSLVQAHERQKQYARATDLALEAWQVLREDPSYGDNAFNLFMNACNVAIQQKAALSAETMKLAEEKFREMAKAYFGGEAQRSSWMYASHTLLGMRNEIDAFAKEAGASDDPKRVQLAAAYYQSNGRGYDEARRLYRRALTLPGADERSIHPQLYQLLAHQHGNQQPIWGDAIELLEKLKAQKQFDENQYLIERGRCLYGLNRREEARAEYRKVMAKPSYWRNGYWQFQSLAYQFQQSKDWAMAAEAWELAIRLLRTQSRGQVDGGTAAQFYQGCAQAYLELGDKEKALDSFLRGMSVVPRNNSYYQQILEVALKQVLNGQALDKTVEEYEKSVAKAGGGEKPHLRIAFADGYRKANDPRKMLKHLGIAADLLPKDTQLRQQVIEGYKKLNDTDAVLAAYMDWAKFDSQNIEIYRGMGDFYESNGRREEAILAWATMAEVRPREAEGYRAYSQRLAAISMHDKAAVALRHALRYRPTEFDISKELSTQYAALSQREKIPALWTTGETACRKAIEDFADDPLPWLNLGRYLGAQNRVKDEQELYREILRRPWPRFQRETYDEANKRLVEAK